MPFDIRRRRQQMEMDPRFQRATYARQMTDPRQLATPNVGDIVRGYAGRQAEVEEYGAAKAAQIGMREKEATTEAGLREKRLGFMEKTRAAQMAASREGLDYQRDVQAAMEKESKTATYLAMADVGLNVLGGYVGIQRAKRQEALMAKQERYFRDMSTVVETFIIELEQKKARKRGRPY